MKRRLALLVCIIATLAMVFALASCGGDECEHTYSTEYTTDANGHWYVATCGCEGEVSNYGAHVDSNNDGKCDTCKYVLCAHTYETEWSTDENNHWNASNCDCTATKANEAKHVDENKDGICDVCKYVMCTHTYSDWKTDETKHWKEATCGCTVANTEEGAHADENKDGNCDTCAYVMCEHTYATEWSTDGAYHWYEATCGCNVVGSKAEHTNEDGDKLCDVCGANICEHTYADVLSYNETHHWYAATCGCDVKKDETEHAWAEAWTINDHKHYYVATCGCEAFKDAADHADEDEDGKCDACGHDTVVSDKIADIDGEAWFGANSSTVNKTEKYDGEEPTTSESYLKVYDNYTVQLDYNGNLRYYSYYGDNGENAFVVLVEGDEARRDEYTTVIEDVYYYSLVYWNVSANNHENMIKGLYNLGLNGGVDWEGNKTGTGYGLISAYDEATSTYSFSYLYVEDTAVYYVEASFTVDAEANGITSANVKIDQYSYASVAVNDDVLSYEIVEGAVAISETTYVIAQAFGDPMDSTEAPNPYSAEKYLITGDFTIVTKDENGDIAETYEGGETIEVDATEELTFYFDATTLEKIPFNTVEVSFSGINYVDGNYYYNSYSDDREITFTGKKAGEYTLTFSVEGNELTLNIKVNYLTPETISPVVVKGEDKLEVTEYTMYTGQTLIVSSKVEEGCDPGFTAALSAGAAAAITANEDGTYTVTPVGTGTFNVVITSTKDETVTATLAVTVAEPPTPAEILNGTHSYSVSMAGLDVSVVFTPDSEGATSGTVVISYLEEGWWETTELNATYTYEYSLAGIALTYVSGDEMSTYSLAINSDYKVVLVNTPYGDMMPDYTIDYVLEKVVVTEPEDKVATTSPFNMTVSDTYNYYDVDEFTFVAGEAGTYTFTVPAGVGILVNWSDEVINCFDNQAGTTFELDLDANEEVLLVAQSTTTGTYEITFTVGTAGGDDTTVEPGLAGNYTATDSWNNAIEVVITEDTITFTPPRSPEVVWTYTYVDGVLTLYSEGTELTNPLMGAATVDAENEIFATLSYNGTEYTLVKQAAGSGETTGTALAIGNNNIEAADVTYTYTAEADGKLSLSCGNAIMGAVTITCTVNGNDAGSVVLGGEALVLDLKSGDKVVITVTAAGYATMNAQWTAGAGAEGVALTIGNNSIEAANVTYVYTAETAGTLNLSVGGAVMGAVEISYTVNGGDSATLALNSNVDLELAAGDKVVITVTAAGYATLAATWTTAE